MKELTKEVLSFFTKQNFVIVSTIDKDGTPHASCKGIIKIEQNGQIYLLDLYTGQTHKNLGRNSCISIAAVDEHRFIGYCLKGNAKVLYLDKVEPDIIKLWKDKIAGRVTHRIIKKMHGEKGHPAHPEILLPQPKYMIVMNVEEIIDLTPGHLK